MKRVFTQEFKVAAKNAGFDVDKVELEMNASADFVLSLTDNGDPKAMLGLKSVARSMSEACEVAVRVGFTGNMFE